jgi:hypothetical protein
MITEIRYVEEDYDNVEGSKKQLEQMRYIPYLRLDEVVELLEQLGHNGLAEQLVNVRNSNRRP